MPYPEDNTACVFATAHATTRLRLLHLLAREHLTRLASGALFNAAIGPYRGKGSDEQTLLRSMADTVEIVDLILSDAFYSTYLFIAALQVKGVDLLMEHTGTGKLSTDFRRGQKLGACDRLIELKKLQQYPRGCPLKTNLHV